MNSIRLPISRVIGPALAATVLLCSGYSTAYAEIDEMIVTAPRVVPEQVQIAEQVHLTAQQAIAAASGVPGRSVQLAGDGPGAEIRVVVSGADPSPRG